MYIPYQLLKYTMFLHSDLHYLVILLASLNLSVNAFDGTIRDAFSSLTSLRLLDLSVNSLSGSVPNGLFDLSTLNTVWLDNNALDGTVPDSIDNAVNLESLRLNGNSLTGTIPSIDSGSLLSLEEFEVHENNLTGEMPPSICQLVVSESLTTLTSDCSSPGTPGFVQCSCCTQCFPL